MLTGTEQMLGSLSADDYSDRSRYEPIANVSGQNVQLLRYQLAVPRVRVVYDIIHAPSQELALEGLLAEDFAPQSSAVVTGVPERRSTRQPTVPEVVEDSPERLEVVVSTIEDGMLIVSDSWHAGWEARIDGEPAIIHRANYLFRAIEIPAGEHVVELVFTPESWRVGRVLTVVTLATMLAVFLLRRRRGEHLT